MPSRFARLLTAVVAGALAACSANGTPSATPSLGGVSSRILPSGEHVVRAGGREIRFAGPMRNAQTGRSWMDPASKKKPFCTAARTMAASSTFIARRASANSRSGSSPPVSSARTACSSTNAAICGSPIPTPLILSRLGAVRPCHTGRSTIPVITPSRSSSTVTEPRLRQMRKARAVSPAP